MAILSSTKSSENIGASAIEVNVKASVIEDASVIKVEEKKMETINYGCNDIGNANIGGLKSGEQSLLKAVNARVKFKYGRVSESVRFDVQISHANRAYGDVDCGFEYLGRAKENSDCTDHAHKNYDNGILKPFSFGELRLRGDAL